MNEKDFDVIVIGGGPAGLISAGISGSLGANVLLLEKNIKVGKKLLLTGKGRCNITNADFNLRSLTEKYGDNGKFLYHAFSVFGPRETINFFNKIGVK